MAAEFAGPLLPGRTSFSQVARLQNADFPPGPGRQPERRSDLEGQNSRSVRPCRRAESKTSRPEIVLAIPGEEREHSRPLADGWRTASPEYRHRMCLPELSCCKRD